MKFTTIYLGGNEIEVSNSLIGKETIKVNGEVVSSKFSITGAEHHFNITEDGVEKACRLIMGFGLNGVVFSLYKDDQPVVESPKSGCLGIIIVIVIVVFLFELLTSFM